MIPLRLVLDTNVVVSAAIKPDGLQLTVFLLAMSKPARLYITNAIMTEYREVLARPRLNIRKGPREQLLQLIKNRAYSVKSGRPLQVTADSDDDEFLECADAAPADHLLTGNQRHFPRFWKKAKVITSSEFIDIVSPHLIPRRRSPGMHIIRYTVLNKVQHERPSLKRPR